MMDLKEIIRWFIPCFHILTRTLSYRNVLCFLFLNCFLLGNASAVFTNSLDDNLVNISSEIVQVNVNKSDSVSEIAFQNETRFASSDVVVGRTFGRPFKKMAQALIPLVFQMGMAATWAIVAAIVGVKTLVVSLIILKLLFAAGAAKIGALVGGKLHHGHEPKWEPPSKEIHLHIHNSKEPHPEVHYPEHDEHVAYSGWNRDSTVADTKNVNVVVEPYKEKPQYVIGPQYSVVPQYVSGSQSQLSSSQIVAGPPTISTPYGNYIRVDNLPSIPNSQVAHIQLK